MFCCSSRRRHTRCALVTGVQTCALPILGADVRRRPNLTILANMAVRHIVFEERRAVAIATESGAIFKGAMIVASAGAIHSPTLLLRSGIGRSEERRVGKE